MAQRELNAYIDESGDEGFRKLGQRADGAHDASSEWLVLAGVLMFAEQDRQRTHMAAEPLHFALVALWKPGIAARSSALTRNKGYLYNYGARLLIERFSWFARNAGRRLNLMFESRASTSYADLERYVADIQRDPSCTIAAGTIASVSPVNANRKGAQIADFYASACAEAFERTPGGYIEEEHLLRLKHQLYRPHGRGSVLNNGLKIFPDDNGHSARLPWLSQL